MKQFEYKVEKVNGRCDCSYKVGDTFRCSSLNTPGEAFCGGAFLVLYPMQVALHGGARFSFEEDPKSKTRLACPDDGIVTFSVTLLEE